MKQIQSKIEQLKRRAEENKDKPNPRNYVDDLKEQIWDLIKSKNPKANRKMFFIKTGGVPSEDLISIRKWAESTDNFNRAFYGAIKKYHLNHKKV